MQIEIQTATQFTNVIVSDIVFEYRVTLSTNNPNCSAEKLVEMINCESISDGSAEDTIANLECFGFKRVNDNDQVLADNEFILVFA